MENKGKLVRRIVKAISKRNELIDLLEAYSLFLEENGYLDTDWRNEEPFAIDEFLKSYSKNGK